MCVNFVNTVKFHVHVRISVYNVIHIQLSQSCEICLYSTCISVTVLCAPVYCVVAKLYIHVRMNVHVYLHVHVYTCTLCNVHVEP